MVMNSQTGNESQRVCGDSNDNDSDNHKDSGNHRESIIRSWQ